MKERTPGERSRHRGSGLLGIPGPGDPTRLVGRPDGVSIGLDAMVTDPIERTYLGTDGWWADLLLAEFAFLAEYGVKPQKPSFHSTGHSLRFFGERHVLAFHYLSQEGLVFAWLTHRPTDVTAYLEDVIAAYAPGRVPPPFVRSDRGSITGTIGFWASGMGEVADRLFPDDRPLYRSVSTEVGGR